MSEQDDITTDDNTEDAGADRTDDQGGDDQLGDAGKKAIDAMKTKWQKERDARKALEDQVAELNTKLATGADKSDGKPDVDAEAIRKQARTEAAAEVLRERVLDKVEAKAAKLFEDPEDARALLASQVDDFIDRGKVDLDAINEAIADLLKRKPHLAATATKRFAGGADGGARKGSSGVAQLTAQDVKRMNPKQIVDARAKGQLDDYMAS